MTADREPVEPGGSRPITARLNALQARAAARGLRIRRAPEPPWGWQLESPHRVVCHGTLDNIEAWLTAAEQRDRDRRSVDPAGVRADS